MSIIVVMKDRLKIYSKSQQTRKSDVVRFSNEVATCLGLDSSITYTAVLSAALDATSFMQIFLREVRVHSDGRLRKAVIINRQVLLTVIIVLLVLAILLIFSLLLADVEEKTFEYGMLRSLGMRQLSLISLLFFQVEWVARSGFSGIYNRWGSRSLSAYRQYC